jgi:Ser/Thr protein kinase RdoA (MazF antagonist)
MRLANLLRDGDRFSVIDFDDCGFGWYMYDLAAALSFVEHEPVVPALVAAWLEGYHSLATPVADDLVEIPTFVMLRRMLLLAWVASHRDTETARRVGGHFTTDTLVLAEDYLSGSLLPGGLVPGM